MSTLPEQFLKKFIRKEMRDRVVHEWRKKPAGLHYRFCYKATELFNDQYKNGRAEFRAEETVLLLRGEETHLIPFSEAEQYLGTGYGVLIVELNGSEFIAETGTEKGDPSETSAGSRRRGELVKAVRRAAGARSR